jgi:beta-hydroxylase
MNTQVKTVRPPAARKILSVKRLRRLAIFLAVIVPALYFLPVITLLYLICGVLDVARHDKLRLETVEKYFTGNGIFTWVLSPINLLADLLSPHNRIIYRLDDLPPAHRAEVETCVNEFIANGPRIKAHVAGQFNGAKRAMLTFKWYDAPQSTGLAIPAFAREYRYIKTIAVSVFNTREATSRHFGPLRFTFRVLYNLDPIQSRDVFIEANDRVHYWADDPLYIFDDTIMHRSVNNVDAVRYCLFMDMVRPNHAERLFYAAIHGSSVISRSFKRMFYKNWSFIR